MCGRFSRFTGQDVIESYFNIDISRIQVTLEYNISPSTVVPVVYKENPVILQGMEWGFLPFWSKERNPKIKPINTRSESLTTGMFSHSFLEKRCLVPTNGFYEWRQTEFGKIPYFISMAENKLFAFAGIYSVWRENKETKPIFSFSIVTTEPNNLMKAIHDRMPVILNEIDQMIWLDSHSSQTKLLEMMSPYTGVMQAHSVSRYVNTPNNQGQICIKYVEPKFSSLDQDQTKLDEFF